MRVGGFEIASLQVNFHLIPFDEARRSLQLFAEEVLPAFTGFRSASPAAR